MLLTGLSRLLSRTQSTRQPRAWVWVRSGAGLDLKQQAGGLLDGRAGRYRTRSANFSTTAVETLL